MTVKSIPESDLPRHSLRVKDQNYIKIWGKKLAFLLKVNLASLFLTRIRPTYERYQEELKRYRMGCGGALSQQMTFDKVTL